MDNVPQLRGIRPNVKTVLRKTAIIVGLTVNSFKMNRNEKRILEQLYGRPHDQNATHIELINHFGIPKPVFFEAIKSLVDSGYIKEITNNNQRNEGLQAWEIIVNGAIAVSETRREIVYNWLRNTVKVAAIVGFVALAIQCALLYQQNLLLKESNNIQKQQTKQSQQQQQTNPIK